MNATQIYGGQLKLVDESQLRQIHQTAMDILCEIGVQVFSKTALELCRDKGIPIVEDSIVFMSKEMIEWAIESAPSHVLLAGQTEEFDLHLEKNRVYLGTGGAAIRIYDVKIGQTRAAALPDLPKMARLCDALDNIHFFIRPVEPPDLSPDDLDIYKFYVSLANTRKNVMGAAYSKESVHKVVEMASIISGGMERLRSRPIISFNVGIISPLRFDTQAVEILFEIVRLGIPVALLATPVAGSTGPATLAGGTSLAHAEALASVVMAQLAQPGAPVLYGPIPRPVNWSTMRGLKGGVESGMMNAVLAQMSHYIEIPQYADAGGTEAKIPDIQAGYEAAANIMLVALAGGNYIHHAAGLLDSDLTACLEKFIIDNDICGMVGRALRGLDINQRDFAFDVIKHVGPGGNFLSEDHTLDNLRTGEIFTPQSACRNEEITTLEKASRIVHDILDEQWPEIIDQRTDERIRDKIGLRFNRRGEPF
jgi:trimethylamine--corrinoid protein Co-methyltransferase